MGICSTVSIDLLSIPFFIHSRSSQRMTPSVSNWVNAALLCLKAYTGLDRLACTAFCDKPGEGLQLLILRDFCSTRLGTPMNLRNSSTACFLNFLSTSMITMPMVILHFLLVCELPDKPRSESSSLGNIYHRVKPSIKRLVKEKRAMLVVSLY